MEKGIIEEINRLNKEIKKLVEEDSPDNIKIEILEDFEDDVFKHNFPPVDLKKALLKGLHLEDKHLYPENPDKKHRGKNYYCIYKKKENLFLVNYILISYLKKLEIITLFHLSPLNYKSEEQRRYEEIQQCLKDFPPKKT